jgi:hypothetical protein
MNSFSVLFHFLVHIQLQDWIRVKEKNRSTIVNTVLVAVLLDLLFKYICM